MLITAIAERNKEDLSAAVALATQLRLRSPQVRMNAHLSRMKDLLSNKNILIEP